MNFTGKSKHSQCSQTVWWIEYIYFAGNFSEFHWKILPFTKLTSCLMNGIYKYIYMYDIYIYISYGDSEVRMEKIKSPARKALNSRQNRRPIEGPSLKPTIPYCCDVLNWTPWCREMLVSRATLRLIDVHTENSFWNLVNVNSNRYQIVFTIFRLIWI